MRTSLVLLVSIVASATTAPLQDTRLFSGDKDAAAVSTEAETHGTKNATDRPAKKKLEQLDGGTKGSTISYLASILNQDSRAESTSDDVQSQRQSNEVKDEALRKNRQHKAMFVDYPVISQLQFPNIVPYDLDYSNDFNEEESRGGSPKNYQESNIFYIRLPPTPYMFVPGLGYISQPPTYSTASLRPQILKPAKPKPVYQKPVNPFIKLPIDFVSNGKPTSVYQWQKKPAKKPTDSPITNLDSLSSEFVSNGKPTSIYQWQANLKPIKRPDDSVNKLNKGPYKFNGKPTSFFLLKSDGTSSARQPLRYQEDNSYY